jgi:hypothetical protein
MIKSAKVAAVILSEAEGDPFLVFAATSLARRFHQLLSDFDLLTFRDFSEQPY